ncbi:MAG: methyltransferase domain-containing protein [Candidatus Kryptoniota bacterium]
MNLHISSTSTATRERKSTKEHWENFWSAKKHVNEVYSNADRVLRNIRKVTDLKGKRVLEVGAGTGRDSFGMVRLGASVVMLDYSMNSLKIIKELAREEQIDVFAVDGNAFSLPFHDETFDIVFHQGLLEHFREKDAESLIRENVRILKQGGLLLVDVPQRYHIYTILKHILIAMNKWFAGWEREFSIGELDRFLRSAGLQIIYRYGEWMYPSLFYRVIREILIKAGIRLPLYPKLSRLTSGIRYKLRNKFSSSLSLYTGISIGVIAKK